MKKQNDALELEQDITSALLEAYEFRNARNKETRRIKIVRNGKILFSFEIMALDGDQWQKCSRQNTRNRGKRTEELNNDRFMSQVIYEATVDEDKERVWKNKEIWAKMNVASGVDVIDKLLIPGERNTIVEAIQKLSGYDDSDVENVILE